MFEHQDTLERLNHNINIKEKLDYIHSVLRNRYKYIDRIAIALYEENTNTVKTFLYSSQDISPLKHYEIPLDDAPSLKQIMTTGKPRVVNDMRIFDEGKQQHTQRLSAQGYAASYTLPLYTDGDFFGFLFYNSYSTSPFNKNALADLDLFGHLIGLSIAQEINTIKNLAATVQSAKDMVHFRDDETGGHLDRMAQYSRLIALELAEKHALSDEFIENVFIYAPLHDLGKIGIPDNILFKPDKLTSDEFDTMKTHTQIGREIIEHMMQNFKLDKIPSIEILKNIAELHHETIDGSGYPYGLKGNDIPIEARIIAVADIFDALTSHRPYKDAWSNEAALDMLNNLADMNQLDRDCVSALNTNLEKIKTIQAQFSELTQ